MTGVSVLALVGVLGPVLWWWAARDVRADRGYFVLFGLAGVAWVGVGDAVASLQGVSLLGDAVDRRNPAAAVALAGATLGITVVFAGANVGEGATVWTTFGPAALGTVAWAIGWGALQAVADVGERVAVERDVAAGWRLAGFLVGEGLIFGVAMAGDYVSAAATFADLVNAAWACGVLVALAAFVEWRRPRAGARWAVAYVTGAMAYAAVRGAGVATWK